MLATEPVMPPFMVVSNDQLDPAIPQERCLLNRSNPAINADDQLGPLVAQLRQALGIQSIPLLNAVGDEVIHPAAQKPDPMPEDRRGGDPIHVIITVNYDSFLISNGSGNAPCRLAEIGQAGGLVQLTPTRG